MCLKLKKSMDIFFACLNENVTVLVISVLFKAFILLVSLLVDTCLEWETGINSLKSN